jgi:hypothetical protein
VLFTCYLRQSRTVAVGSDGASQALQAWDLVHGNLLLHGWWVTDVSFYTTELPQYALLELARGLNADVIHVAGALTYTLLVLAAALLARGRTAGRAGLGRALLAAGIMLAPQLGPGTKTLVLSPDHTGTSIPVLLILLLIDRVLPGETDRGDEAGPGDTRPGDPGPGNTGSRDTARRVARWSVPLLVWLGLTWTALADAMTLFIAVVPLALVSAIRLARARAWRGRAAVRRPEAGLALAALLSVPAELAAAGLIRAHGGWQVNGLRTALAGAGQLAGNARLAGQGLLELFGADVFGATGPVPTALAAVHLAGAALAAAGTLSVARHFLRRPERVGQPDLVEQVLLAGIVIDLAAYLAGVQAVDILSTREIAPVLPFAAVLAGRRLGRTGRGAGAVRGWARLRRGPAARGGAVRRPGPLAAGAAPHGGPQRLSRGQHRDAGKRRRGHPAGGDERPRRPPGGLHLERQCRLVRPGPGQRPLPRARRRRGAPDGPPGGRHLWPPGSPLSLQDVRNLGLAAWRQPAHRAEERPIRRRGESEERVSGRYGGSA